MNVSLNEKVTLSIAIVSWNTCELTRNCIQSIIDNTKDVDYEIIVVDNASTDDSIRVIERNFPQVRLIKNSQNLMFAEPNNRALEISRGKYLLLLNSDTIVHGDALEKMVDFLESHLEAGAVTCKFLNPDGSTQYNMHRRFPTFLRLVSGYLYKRYPKFKTKWAREYLMLDNSFNTTQKIEQAAAACIMIRKHILEHIDGLFDAEMFPLLYNDVDLCYRLNKKRYRLYLIPYAAITHLKEMSLKKLDFSWRRREEAISNALFFKKYKKYVDYILTKIAYLFLFSSIAMYSLILLSVRKISFATFKGRLSLPLSILADRKVDL